MDAYSVQYYYYYNYEMEGVPEMKWAHALAVFSVI